MPWGMIHVNRKAILIQLFATSESMWRQLLIARCHIACKRYCLDLFYYINASVIFKPFRVIVNLNEKLTIFCIDS